MKTIYIFMISFWGSATLFGQVGINNSNPKTTFHILGNPTDVTAMDGLTIPQLTGDQLAAKTYGADQKGVMVYVTDLPSSATGQVANIKTTGIYFFENNEWKKVLSGEESQGNPETVSMYKTTSVALPNSWSPTAPILYNSTKYNPDGWYNTSTGVFKPTIAGYYIVTASLRIYRGSQTADIDLRFVYNGNYYGRVAAFGSVVNNITRLFYFNGTTDNLSIMSAANASATQVQTESYSYFSAIYVGKSLQKTTQEINSYTGTANKLGLVGDIKQGFQTGDHQGWIKLDGRAVNTLTATQKKIAKAMGYSDNIPDVSNAYLSNYGSGKLGSLQGSNNIYLERNQLPAVQLDLNINNGGKHRHGILMPVSDNTNGLPMYENAVGAPWNLPNGGRETVETESGSGDHTHTGTLNYLHSDSGLSVAQSAIDARPITANVNTFIFLGD